MTRVFAGFQPIYYLPGVEVTCDQNPTPRKIKARNKAKLVKFQYKLTYFMLNFKQASKKIWASKSNFLANKSSFMQIRIFLAKKITYQINSQLLSKLS